MTGRGRVGFVGAVAEAAPALDVVLAHPAVEPVVVVTPDRPASGTLSGWVDLHATARAAGVRVLATDDVNAPSTWEVLAALDLDLLVVVGWTRLVAPHVLALPRHGCVGFHASLLPHDRGRAPVNWAILRGEAMSGNTLMYLAAAADAGDVVDQVALPIGPTDTCATVYDRVGAAGAAMLDQHLAALVTGTAPRRPQPVTDEPLLPRRTPAMGILDWDRPARRVHDWVRALTAPYPGAFTEIDGEPVWVWSTDVPEAGAPVGGPGQVLGVEGDAIRVGSRDGSVVVTSMSSAGQDPVPAAAWLAGSGHGVGLRFDRVSVQRSAWSRAEQPEPEPAR